MFSDDKCDQDEQSQSSTGTDGFDDALRLFRFSLVLCVKNKLTKSYTENHGEPQRKNRHCVLTATSRVIRIGTVWRHSSGL